MKTKYHNIRDSHGKFMSMAKLATIATSKNPVKTAKKLSDKSISKSVKKVVPYSKLTIVEKRKAIAKDVIKWIKKEILQPASGNGYCEIYFDEDNINYDKKYQLNKLIIKDKLSCTVCGIGSMMISHIIKNNHFTVGENINDVDREDIINRVKEFSRYQHDLIEIAFEKGGSSDFGLSYEDYTEARNFGYRYEDDSERLIAIMNNIIKNPKGLFKP